MSRRHGPALQDRRRAGEPRVDEAPASRELQSHCWVIDAPGHPGRYAGLLVEWRRDQGNWSGRVVYVIPEPGGGVPRLIERWLPAACLQQA